MRIAVLSNIHGNPWTLEAVLGDIRRRNSDRPGVEAGPVRRLRLGRA